MNHIEIIKAFKQGIVNLEQGSSLGNCASIALIKSSLEIFGLNNLYSYRFEEGIHFISLKDNSEVIFTDEELARSNDVIGFVLNTSEPDKLELYTEIYNQARLTMCVMAKRVEQIGEAGQGHGDFEKALLALNDGANTEYLPKVLGLQNYFSKPKWFMSKKYKAMMGWLSGHTVYISQGYYDYYGKVKKIRKWKYPKRMRLINN